MNEIPFYGQLKDVNTTDVEDAIRLGCQTMQNVFNADDNDIPFFSSRVRPDAYLGFSGAHTEAHIPGRHLNALLNAEDAIGIELDESAVRKHADAAYFSFSGPVAVPLNRERTDGPLNFFLTHNFREGMHALYPLVKYRDEERAHDLAEACIAAILDLWSSNRGWNIQRCRDRVGIEPTERTFISGLARVLGPLVKYYRVNQSPAALDLALTLKERLLVDTFPEDGHYDLAVHGTHTHSTTCVMSSLAQIAELTDDASLLSRVKAFYDHGLPDFSDQLGWVVESSDVDRNPDRGEVNNTGDIVETALILGCAGHTECLEDAERIVRCHILPSQLRDIDFIVDPPNPDGVNGLHNVAARHQGAFGFPAPYGHEPVDIDRVSFNMDIVGGAVASLCEVYRDATTFGETGHHVNLLFDHETDAITVQSDVTHNDLCVTLKKPGPLWIRIPSWASRSEIDVARGKFVGSHLFIPDLPVGEPAIVNYDLPIRDIVLPHRTRDIRVKLKGDSVVAMDNFGADLTFFDPIDK
jgi:hypothetical protein